MAATKRYNLKWRNHQLNMVAMCTMLRDSHTLADVTLAADNGQLQAHKMILASCSAYFHSLFVGNPSQHAIVVLKNVDIFDLRVVVDYMYKGKVTIKREQLSRILHCAKSLDVKGFSEAELIMCSPESPHHPIFSHQSGEPSNTPSASRVNKEPLAKRRRRSVGSNGSSSPELVINENYGNLSAPHAEACRVLRSVACPSPRLAVPTTVRAEVPAALGTATRPALRSTDPTAASVVASPLQAAGPAGAAYGALPSNTQSVQRRGRGRPPKRAAQALNAQI